MQKPFWVVDVEGNGGSPPEIVELAILELADMQFTGNQRHTLVRPNSPIQPAVTNIHGITDEDVVNAPTFEDISDDLSLWLDGAQIVGHNVRVELEILSRSFIAWAPQSAIDTLLIAKFLRPGLESYGLEKLGKALGLTEEAERLTGRKHHAALYDATLAALIFVHLLAPLPPEKQQEILRDADILNPRQGILL